MEIFRIDVNDSNLLQLTHTEPGHRNHPLGSYAPSYSPNGKKIVFNRNGNGVGDDIYVMDADGMNMVRLTSHPAADFLPYFSPDGTKIVFTSDRDGDSEIFVMDADGKNLKQLTNNEHKDWYASFSPDGKKIAYSSAIDGLEDIWIMDADGGNKTRLTNNDRKVAHGPDFSPDGQTIVFVSDIYGKHGNNAQVWTIGVDGKGLKCLTDRNAFHSGVDFSPCGKYIAYKSNWGGSWNIFVINADGSNIRQVTNSKSEDLNTRGGWKY